MTKGQQDFLVQMTRKLMVEWCDKALRENREEAEVETFTDDPYVNHAVEKNWVSVKSRHYGANKQFVTLRILSNGWQTAARFLKR